MSDKSIPFAVDDEQPVLPGAKAGRSPLEHILASQAAQSSKVIDVQLKALATQLQEKISDLNEVLSQVDTSNGIFDLDSVSLTLAVTSSGKIVVLSTIEGSISPQVGLQLTLKRRKG